MLPEAGTPALYYDGLPVSLMGAPVLDGDPAVLSDDADGSDPGPLPPVLTPPPGILESESEIFSVDC